MTINENKSAVSGNGSNDSNSNYSRDMQDFLDTLSVLTEMMETKMEEAKSREDVPASPTLIVSNMGFFKDLGLFIHDMARRKGWYDSERSFGEYMALIHSEVSEALEEFRNGHHALRFETDSDGNSKPEGIAIELADVIIRVLDTCAFYKIDMDEAIQLKLKYNETRGHRHGGKLL